MRRTESDIESWARMRPCGTGRTSLVRSARGGGGSLKAWAGNARPPTTHAGNRINSDRRGTATDTSRSCGIGKGLLR